VVVVADRAGCVPRVTRFDEFQQRLGISRGVLNQRLVRLVDVGVLAKVPYSARPPRYDYRVTEKGRDLWPVVTAMRRWGDKHAGPEGPPVRLVHEDCGEISEAHLVCSACGKRDAKAIPGPGAAEPLVRVV
jgi:DNA-binding HxlR family transcriptional regulator